MKERRKVLFSFMAAILFISFGVWLSTTVKPSHKGQPRTIQEVQSRLQQDIPVGANKNAVEQWCKKNKIEYSAYRRPGRFLLTAVVRKTSDNWLVTGDAYINFIFNGQGNLQQYTVSEIFTGP
jgi:hypothetical protein